MPYRVDIRHAGADVFDRLIELGALDADISANGDVAAILPDRVDPRDIGLDGLAIAPARGRDADSVWILSPRPHRVGRLRLVPADAASDPGDLRLIDSGAFGTGLHPTTVLCLEVLDETIATARPDAMLDVGTGSGVLAIAALTLGVSEAMGIDVDRNALHAAAANARENGLASRLALTHGTVNDVDGRWPLVVANVLAAPLIEMAPAIARRVGHEGYLVLSGIASSLEADVTIAYRHRGMTFVRSRSRAGWVALLLRASW